MNSKKGCSAHWQRWGYHITSNIQSRILPYEAFRSALKAREQLQKITESIFDGGNIYLEGSIVTTGLMEKGSDLDMNCITSTYGSVPDAKTAGKLSDKLYHKIKYSIPSQSRIQHIDMVRIPLVKYDANTSPQVTESILTQLTSEREKNSRTAYFNFSFNLNSKKETDLKNLLRSTGCAIEEMNLDNRNGSAVFTFRTASTNDTLRCLGVLPDGKSGIISKSTKDRYTRGTPSPFDLPELLRFSFDVTFLGYAVRNSYLIRKYLNDSRGPKVSRICQMAIKRWGKVTEFGVGAKGNLTSYGMTIMWIYFLLRTGQVGWYDPWKIPDALFLPQYPDFIPLDENVDYESVASQLHEFFMFYSKFDFRNEVISLSRSRNSTRSDVGWNFLKREKFNFLLCIEDPYEDDLNCARRIDARKLEWFKDLCQKALQNMSGPPETHLERVIGRAT
ncbi:hypothetical protein XU18_0900 [Perkinsela sp. CCAP 1560/4]|nr:hypothetical protein XU18_0900 [Perkinsela sp. CCAP 1560/4]|eukprot:KNH08614.1 hypothetical protein XU18_0900 [Perkinsela sp. CCAP 1560/4]